MFNKKGQAVMLDLLMGAVLFLLVLMALNTLWVEELDSIILEKESNEMKLLAFNAIEVLVSSKGIPQNWEILPEASVDEIGLVSNDRAVEEDKLVAFQNIGYSAAKEKLNIKQYDFFFEFDGVDDVNAGIPPVGNAEKIVIYRKASYKGGSADVKFTLYDLR